LFELDLILEFGVRGGFVADGGLLNVFDSSAIFKLGMSKLDSRGFYSSFISLSYSSMSSLKSSS